jgi:hypothetical protein
MKTQKNKNVAETIMVLPIDTVKLVEDITEELLKEQMKQLKKEGNFDIVFKTHKVALFKDYNIMTDNECCYEVSNEKNPKFSFPITYSGKRIDEESGKEVNFQTMFPLGNIIIDRQEIEEKYLLEQVSLKEFMVGRYEYNPRIINNTRNLIKRELGLDYKPEKQHIYR